MIISTEPLASQLPPDAEDAQEPSALDAELRSLEVPAALHGQRLDKALVELVTEFSRSYLQQLIDDSAVSLNGQILKKPAQRLQAGDQIAITLRPTPQSQAFKPEPMDLKVVYQDAHLLVVDKPAGLVVHPAPGNWSGTLLNGLLALDAQCAVLPRAGIVHRLDKDTSGLMVVARTRLCMDALVAMIAARDVSRKYIAIGHRMWTGEEQRSVEAPIGRDPRNRLRMAAVDLNHVPGKPARTDIELLQNIEQTNEQMRRQESVRPNSQEAASLLDGTYCMVRCVLHSGRTHQIRVHMALLGHPLIADEVYGGATAAGLTRQALHAQQLGFVHPMTGQTLQFASDLPDDLVAACTALGLRYNV